MNFRDLSVLVGLLTSPFHAMAQQASVPTPTPLFMEYLEYEQRVESAAEGTELGERPRFDTSFRYQYTPSTFLRFRFEIDPNNRSAEHKTSKFELRLNHRQENWEFQADFDLNGDDSGRGATSLGLDYDSDDSFVAYRFGRVARAFFYPYNFGGEVGAVFRSPDVTRIFYIEGTPTIVSSVVVKDEKVRMKTLPGFVFEWTPTPSVMAYAGVASARFLYPAVEGFDIVQSPSAERWQVKEDRGYKAGFRWSEGASRVVLEGVRHEHAAQVGSLLESAWSLQAQHPWRRFGLGFEHTQTKAGSMTYRLSGDGRWFQDTTPFRPVYSDSSGQKQDWLGKVDAADTVQVSYILLDWSPYVAWKHLGPHFLNRDRESAHRLRTADESASHGGLDIYAVGVEFNSGTFVVRPELEFMQAKNAVFGNRSDLREDRILSNLSKKDRVLTLNLTYVN